MTVLHGPWMMRYKFRVVSYRYVVISENTSQKIQGVEEVAQVAALKRRLNVWHQLLEFKPSCSPRSDFAHVPLFVSHNYSGLTIGLVY